MTVNDGGNTAQKVTELIPKRTSLTKAFEQLDLGKNAVNIKIDKSIAEGIERKTTYSVTITVTAAALLLILYFLIR